MVVDRNGHGTFGVLLPHHVLGELVVDLVRRGHATDDLSRHVLKLKLLGFFGLRSLLLQPQRIHEIGELLLACGAREIVRDGIFQDVGACHDALVADIDVIGRLDELANLTLLLAAERAADGALRAGIALAAVIAQTVVVIVSHYSASLAACAREVTIRSIRPYSRASSAVR